MVVLKSSSGFFLFQVEYRLFPGEALAIFGSIIPVSHLGKPFLSSGVSVQPLVPAVCGGLHPDQKCFSCFSKVLHRNERTLLGKIAFEYDQNS